MDVSMFANYGPSTVKPEKRKKALLSKWEKKEDQGPNEERVAPTLDKFMLKFKTSKDVKSEGVPLTVSAKG